MYVIMYESDGDYESRTGVGFTTPDIFEAKYFESIDSAALYAKNNLISSVRIEAEEVFDFEYVLLYQDYPDSFVVRGPYRYNEAVSFQKKDGGGGVLLRLEKHQAHS